MVLAKQLIAKGMNASRRVSQTKTMKSELYVKNAKRRLHLTNLECNTKNTFAIDLTNQLDQAMLLRSIQSVTIQTLSLSRKCYLSLVLKALTQLVQTAVDAERFCSCHEQRKCSTQFYEAFFYEAFTYDWGTISS